MFLLRVIQTFDQKKIPYALAGGYAVALHGAPRGTIDVDLIVRLSISNLKAAESALQSLGLQSRLPITSEDVFKFKKEYIENRNMVAWGFINPQNPIEMVDILLVKDLSSVKTKTVRIQNYPVKIISMHDLIKMKTESNREQDRVDVAALKSLQ